MPEKKLSRFFPAVSRDPQLDAVRDDLNRLKLLWVVSTTSPLLYLTVSHYIRLTFFGPPDDLGFSTLTAQAFQYAVGACAAVAVGVQALHFFLRRRFASDLRSGKHVTELLRVYRNRTLALMAASEAPVLMGFVLFLVQGQQWTVFLFGALSLVYYAQSYPSETMLGKFAKTKSAA